MSIKYLPEIVLYDLTDEELDNYASDLMSEQIDIMDAIDTYQDNYDLVTKEYTRRRAKRSFTIDNKSTTRH